MNGQDGLVLIDILNHTLEGWVQFHFSFDNTYCNVRNSLRDSGVGDFGEEGIVTLLRDHRSNMCKLLRLHTDVPFNMGSNLKLPAISKGKGKAREKAHDSDDSKRDLVTGAVKE